MGTLKTHEEGREEKQKKRQLEVSGNMKGVMQYLELVCLSYCFVRAFSKKTYPHHAKCEITVILINFTIEYCKSIKIGVYLIVGFSGLSQLESTANINRFTVIKRLSPSQCRGYIM